MAWIEAAFRFLASWIDNAIFTFVEACYNVFLSIAMLPNIIEESEIKTFSDRIYVLIGILMLFKLSFSIIKYIINPDEFQDKSKGGKKLVIQVMLVMVLIVFTPTAFRYAYDLQNAILSEGILQKIIFGQSSGNNDINNFGKQAALSVFTAFYYPSDSNCRSAVENALLTKSEDVAISACSDSFSSSSVANAYIAAVTNPGDESPIKLMLRNNGYDIYKDKKSDEYSIQYNAIVSSIAGIVLALIFINFCFDIALRAAKLAFLQIIAPIPIISYLDPTSGKNGMFGKWLKECTNTYLSLFLRLISVFFAIYVINAFWTSSHDILTGSSFMFKIFIMGGILMFAVQVPKLIEDLTGIKSSGTFTVNPFKKIAQVPVLGKAATAFVGGAAGAVAGAVAGSESGHGFKGAGYGALSGAFSTGSKVSWAGAKPGSSPVKAISTGSHQAYKDLTGRDYANFSLRSFEGHLKHDKIKKEISNYKEQRKPFLNKAAEYEALHNDLLYQYNNATSNEEREKLMQQIQKVKADMSSNQGDIDTLNDRIKDVKKFFNYDDSAKQDLRKIQAKLDSYEEGGKTKYRFADSSDSSPNIQPMPDRPAPNPVPESQQRNMDNSNVLRPTPGQIRDEMSNFRNQNDINRNNNDLNRNNNGSNNRG